MIISILCIIIISISSNYRFVMNKSCVFVYTSRSELFALRAILLLDCFLILTFHYYYYRHHHYTNSSMYEYVVVCTTACIIMRIFVLFLAVILWRIQWLLLYRQFVLKLAEKVRNWSIYQKLLEQLPLWGSERSMHTRPTCDLSPAARLADRKWLNSSACAQQTRHLSFTWRV